MHADIILALPDSLWLILGLFITSGFGIVAAVVLMKRTKPTYSHYYGYQREHSPWLWVFFVGAIVATVILGIANAVAWSGSREAPQSFYESLSEQAQERYGAEATPELMASLLGNPSTPPPGEVEVYEERTIIVEGTPQLVGLAWFGDHWVLIEGLDLEAGEDWSADQLVELPLAGSDEQ